MKKNVFSLCFIFLFINTYGQTYLGIALGIDNAKFEEKPNSINFIIGENDYSMVYGLRLTQHLSKNVVLDLSSTYTKKRIWANCGCFRPLEPVQFHYFKQVVLFKYQLISNGYFGLGGSFNIIPRLYEVEYDTYMKKTREFSGIASISYKYRDFLLELRYYEGFLS